MPDLEHLHLSYNSKVSLEPLRSCLRLQSLTIGSVASGRREKCAGPSPLATLKQLRRLTIASASSMQVLKGLVHLEELDVVGTVKDISPLASLTRLRVLKIRGLPVTSVQALTRLVALERLEMHIAPVADLEPLETLTRLTRLSLFVDKVATEFGFLPHLVALEELDLTGVHVDSVAKCAGLPQLKRLRVSHSVEVVRALRSLPRVKDIDVQFA